MIYLKISSWNMAISMSSSSIHELLLIPTPDDSNIDEITKMNQQVNEEQVGIEEVLGTKAYYYSKDRGFVL